MKAQDQKAAIDFFKDLSATLGIVLLGIIGVLELGCLGALSLGSLGGDSREILHLTMLSLPGLLFVALFALHSGFLQCEGRFFLTGVAPAVFNIAWIGTLWLFRNKEIHQITTYLAIAIDLAFLLQFLLILPSTLKKLQTYRLFTGIKIGSLFTKDIRAMIRAISYSIIGVSAMQINSFIDVLFAKIAHPSGPAHLTYAIRLEQLPLALFGLSIVTAFFPVFSRWIEENQKEQAADLLQKTTSKLIVFLLPSTALLLLLATPLVDVLFGRGLFGKSSTEHTSLCLVGYAAGLLPSALALLFSQVFFAKKEFKVPMYLSLFVVGLNIVFNTLFVFFFALGSFSIALATSLSSLVNAALLYHLIVKRYAFKAFAHTGFFLFKITSITVLSSACSIYSNSFLHPIEMSHRKFLDQTVCFGVPCFFFLLSFFIFSVLFNLKEVTQFFPRFIQWRKKDTIPS